MTGGFDLQEPMTPLDSGIAPSALYHLELLWIHRSESHKSIDPSSNSSDDPEIDPYTYCEEVET